jgi:hypothetical protein
MSHNRQYVKATNIAFVTIEASSIEFLGEATATIIRKEENESYSSYASLNPKQRIQTSSLATTRYSVIEKIVQTADIPSRIQSTIANIVQPTTTGKLVEYKFTRTLVDTYESATEYYYTCHNLRSSQLTRSACSRSTQHLSHENKQISTSRTVKALPQQSGDGTLTAIKTAAYAKESDEFVEWTICVTNKSERQCTVVQIIDYFPPNVDIVYISHPATVNRTTEDTIIASINCFDTLAPHSAWFIKIITRMKYD